MNNLDKQYQNLLQDILDNGVQKETRNGKTISVFGRQIRHKMSEFPLLTTKKMAWKSIITELLWFLRGDTNIKYLVDNDCHIWDGDAYQAYLKGGDIKWLKQMEVDTPIGKMNVPVPYSQEEFIEQIKTNDEFAKKWGNLGKIYGFQWRNWNGKTKDELYEEFGNKGIDQISDLIKQLKENPDSRRLIVNAWAVDDLPNMVLPPCHYGFQVYTRELSLEERFRVAGNNWPPSGLPNQGIHFMNEKNIPTRAISLMFNMRSTDVGLGLGFNLASYGLLLMMIAKQVDMIPDELIYNGGDVHLYLNHIEPIKEQLTRESYDLPTVKISDRVVNDICEYTLDDFTLENYQYHPTIRMPLSN